jgi:hypothetical protein
MPRFSSWFRCLDCDFRTRWIDRAVAHEEDNAGHEVAEYDEAFLP